MRHPHIVNERDVTAEEKTPADTGFSRRRLSREAGADRLGCSLYTLAPGKSSWPYHYHAANEEAIYVLEGTASLHIDGEDVEPRPRDYVSLPVGTDGAHRLTNDGDAPVRYLCLSTMVEPDVAFYPDRNMIGVFAGAPPRWRGDRDVSQTLPACRRGGRLLGTDG